MSTAQSTALAAALGPGSLAVMGGSAAANAALDVIERGGTNNQAFASGIAAGFAEVLFEKFSVDNLLKGVGDSTFFKSLLKQGGIEASEEMATEVANILSDAAIMGQSSRFHEAVRAYMELGQVSEEEAEKKAFLDCVADVGLAGLGGFLSGGSSMAMIGGSRLAADRLLGNKKAASGEAASKYTKEEADAIRYEGKTFRNLVAGIDATVSEFFSRWAGGRKSHMGEKLEKLYLGKMPDEIKAEVSGILGYEVTERDFIVTNDDVKHIMDRHGNPAAEIRKGNLPLDQWALDVLPEVVTAPDAVKKGHEGTGRNKGKTGVVISKSFPNGRVVSVQYDNKGRRTLEITTIYAKESTTSMVNAPKETNTFTSKTTEPVLSLKPMIQQRKGKVNESQLEQDPFLQGFNEGESEDTDPGTAVEGWEDDPFLQGFYEEDEELHSKKTREVSGIVRDTNFRKANLSSKTVRELDAVAKVAGVEVRFAPEVAVNGKKGNAKYENGVITIALDAKDPIRTAFTHEIIHRIKEVSPEVYKTLSDFVQGHMRQGSLEALGEFYSEAYETDDVSIWTEEMVADAFGTMLSDSTMMGQFVQDNRTAAQKVLDAIQDFVAAIKRMLNGQNVRLSREERNAFSELQTDLEGMEKTLADALNAIEGSKNAAREEKLAKLSAMEKFGMDLDEDELYNDLEKDNLELRGEPANMPVDSREWHAFNRSFANKTARMKRGEERDIVIFTDRSVYLVAADGYMQGFVEMKIPAESRKYAEIRRFYDGFDAARDVPDSMAEGYAAIGGGYGWHSGISEYPGRAGRTDGLSGGEPESNPTGDIEEDEADYYEEETELIPGSLIYDGNGHGYRVNEYGSLEEIKLSRIVDRKKVGTLLSR